MDEEMKNLALETVGFMDEEMSSAPRGNTSFGMPVFNREGNVQIGMGNIPKPIATE